VLFSALLGDKVAQYLPGDCTIHSIPTDSDLGLGLLETHGWLASEPLEFKRWAALSGRWRLYKPGQFVYFSGDASDGIFGLASGGLEVTFPLVAEEPVVLHRAQVGFWIGDNGELSDTPRTISLMAATECRMLHLPRDSIRNLLTSEPKYWQSFYRLATINTSIAVGLLAEVLSLTLRARMCRRLLQLTDNSMDVTVTQDDISKMLGVYRSTLRPILNKLVKSGAIELGYRRIRVIDRNILKSFKDEQ
jgi:CRP/FNR family cyclic AMP-dependent transcriptional regulator